MHDECTCFSDTSLLRSHWQLASDVACLFPRTKDTKGRHVLYLNGLLAVCM